MNVGTEVERATGLEDAIAFRSDAEEELAAPLEPAGLLTPQAAVRMALTFDPRVQSSLAKVRVAEAQADQARLVPNPILGIDLRFVVGSGGNQVFEPTLAADLLSLLQKPATISAADRRLRGSAADALTTVLDVIAEIQETYAAARSADEEVANAQRRLELLGQLRAIAQRRLEAGEVAKLDVLTLDAQQMQAEIDLSDLRLRRATERTTLARLIGRPRDAAEWTLVKWEPPQAGAAPEGAWVDAGLASRPEIASKGWELAALGDELAAAPYSVLQGGEVGVHAERDPEWRVGPTLTIPVPIFDFGQATRARMEAQRVAARHEQAQQRLMVIQEIRIAYATYAQAVKTLGVTEEKLLPLQQSQLEQARRAYQAGDADLATLVLAQTNLELALSKAIELRERVTVARIKLERAAGGAAVAARVAPGTASTRPARGPATRGD